MKTLSRNVLLLMTMGTIAACGVSTKKENHDNKKKNTKKVP